MEINKKRIEYLDIIKFISIILVIFCHNPLLKNDSILSNILMLLCWAAVPMFFMTTGAIYLNKEFEYKKWGKRIIKTYIVLVVWKIIYLIFFVCWKNIKILEISKISIIQYVFFFKGLSGINADHMWFIGAYLTVILLYPIISLCFNEKNNQYSKYFKTIFILIIIGAFVICDVTIIFNTISNALNKNTIDLTGVKQIISLGSYSSSIIFFILGGILSQYKLSEKHLKRRTIVCLLIGVLIGILGLLFLRYEMTHTFTWDYVYLSNGYSHIPTLILAISIFALIQTINMKSNKIINIIAQNTLGIFYVHIIIINLVQTILKSQGILYNLLKTLITLMISTTLCYIMKKIKVFKEIF